MVASRFIELCSSNINLSTKNFEITSLDEKTLDITDKNLVRNYFSQNKFDSIVNFAAFTNVDGAEAQKDDKNGLVWKLNVEGPQNLAEVCKEKNIFLIHISTDFIFQGNEANPGPYNEEAELPSHSDGIGWYGWTKNRAEFALSATPRVAIIRYGYPFRAEKYESKLDWARNLLKLYNEQKLYPLFDDQVFSILFVDDLIDPLSKIINMELSGIFHIASSDTTTAYEAGYYLLEKYSGKSIQIEKGSMVEFLKTPGRTPRPRLGGLKVEGTEEKLGIKFKTWRQMVDEFVEQIQ